MAAKVQIVDSSVLVSLILNMSALWYGAKTILSHFFTP